MRRIGAVRLAIGSVWDKIDKELLKKELQKQRGGGNEAIQRERRESRRSVSFEPSATTAPSATASSVDGLDFDLGVDIPMGIEEEQQQQRKQQRQQQTRTPPASSTASQQPQSGGAPGGGDKAFKDVLSDIIAGDKGATRDTRRTRMIDRLRDLRLEGRWHVAVGMMSTAVAEGRLQRWQGYHFAELVEILVEAQQWAKTHQIFDIAGVGNSTKPGTTAAASEAPAAEKNTIAETVTVEEQNVDQLIRKLANHRGPASLVTRLGEYATNKGYALRPYAQQQLMSAHLRQGGWETALATLQREKGDAAITISDINVVIRKASGNRDVVDSIVQLATDQLGLRLNAASFAAMGARGDPSWVAAVQCFSEAREAEVVTPCASPDRNTSDMAHFLLDRLKRNRRVEEYDTVLRMIDFGREDAAVAGEDSSAPESDAFYFAASKGVLEHAMTSLVQRGRWVEACSLYSAATTGEQPRIPKPTSKANADYIRAMAKGKHNSRRIVGTFTEMRASGGDVSMDAAVALINAYSSRQVQGSRKRFR